jgi:hypothetical protein
MMEYYLHRYRPESFQMSSGWEVERSKEDVRQLLKESEWARVIAQAREYDDCCFRESESEPR